MRAFLCRLAAIVCLSLPAAGCFETVMNKIEAGVTRIDERIVANQKTFKAACASGQAVHDKIVISQTSGLYNWSAKDIAAELAAYNTGADLCASLPTDLVSLFLAIPKIQKWVESLNNWVAG